MGSQFTPLKVSKTKGGNFRHHRDFKNYDPNLPFFIIPTSIVIVRMLQYNSVYFFLFRFLVNMSRESSFLLEFSFVLVLFGSFISPTVRVAKTELATLENNSNAVVSE